ncbi:hypothetical protein IC007_1847 [Sulfuracidifex tepidarius]|uniref:Uncharacterized protein n=1 Tax=Sulfuracidifex tepidarius TaxID=1294262 RepID=A0A510E455_9CREN|nr:hypothetical protein IC007_1847 [Sulfuracidifex tepidarius]
MSRRPLIRYGDHVLKHCNDIIEKQRNGSQGCTDCLLYGLTEIIQRCIIPIFNNCTNRGLCIDEPINSNLGEVSRRTFYIRYTHRLRIVIAEEGNGNFVVVTFFPDDSVNNISPIEIRCLDNSDYCRIVCHTPHGMFEHFNIRS